MLLCTRLQRLLLPLLLFTACTGSGGGSSPLAPAAPNELVFCRARSDNPHNFSEIALRSAQNQGTSRVQERAGREFHVRAHPDGKRVVFARERQNGEIDSRELFVSSIDGSAAERRLTLDATADDMPCWSPDGTAILWSTAREGLRSLYVANSLGDSQRQFLTPPTGAADSDPDWHRTTDRIAFSRRDADGRQRIWLVHGDGTGAIPLTTGLPPGGESGDREPAFSPDGSKVAFVRVVAGALARLMTADVTTGQATELLDAATDVRMPRWSADRLFAAVGQAALGRPGRRLAVMRHDGTDLLLVQPDKRYEIDGLDVLPALGSTPAAAPTQALDIEQAEVQIASGVALFGSRQQLRDADDDELRLQTVTFDNQEIAGINCRFALPVTEASDFLALRVRVLARATRVGGGSVLRLSFYNPVDERFDTVTELEPSTTAQQVLTFGCASLRHVTRQREVRFTVIAELAQGAAAELRIDQVQAEVVVRAPAPANLR